MYETRRKLNKNVLYHVTKLAKSGLVARDLWRHATWYRSAIIHHPEIHVHQRPFHSNRHFIHILASHRSSLPFNDTHPTLRKTLGSSQWVALFQILGSLLVLVRLPSRFDAFDWTHVVAVVLWKWKSEQTRSKCEEKRRLSLFDILWTLLDMKVIIRLNISFWRARIREYKICPSKTFHVSTMMHLSAFGDKQQAKQQQRDKGSKHQWRPRIYLSLSLWRVIGRNRRQARKIPRINNFGAPTLQISPTFDVSLPS